MLSAKLALSNTPSKMIKIWFEPHSITTDNEEGLASGWNDVDLSEEGVRRLHEQWPPRYKERNIDVIFASDMQRSYKCGALISAQNRIPMYVDQRLRECDYGDFTQKSKDEVNGQKDKRIDTPFPNGESYEDCIKRMKDFLAWLKHNFDGATVMIVGHRATQYGLEYWINGKDIKSCVTEPWSYQPGWEYELK